MWWQPLIGLVLIAVLSQLLRMWFPEMSFGLMLLFVIPIVVVVRVALITKQRHSSGPRR